MSVQPGSTRRFQKRNEPGRTPTERLFGWVVRSWAGAIRKMHDQTRGLGWLAHPRGGSAEAAAWHDCYRPRHRRPEWSRIRGRDDPALAKRPWKLPRLSQEWPRRVWP